MTVVQSKVIAALVMDPVGAEAVASDVRCDSNGESGGVGASAECVVERLRCDGRGRVFDAAESAAMAIPKHRPTGARVVRADGGAIRHCKLIRQKNRACHVSLGGRDYPLERFELVAPSNILVASGSRLTDTSACPKEPTDGESVAIFRDGPDESIDLVERQPATSTTRRRWRLRVGRTKRCTPSGSLGPASSRANPQ